MNKVKRNFHRGLLPYPLDYYKRELPSLKVSSKWAMTLCPFHDDHKPSLSVNVETGAYRCFACQENGGDIIDFHRRLYGVDFVTAAKELGAWEVGA